MSTRVGSVVLLWPWAWWTSVSSCTLDVERMVCGVVVLVVAMMLSILLLVVHAYTGTHWGQSFTQAECIFVGIIEGAKSNKLSHVAS